MLNTILGSLSVGVVPSTNSYESIATVTVGSGGSSSISFTSIPSTYTHLQIRYIARTNNTGIYGKLTFNSDTTGANYYSHGLTGNGSSASANAWAGSTYSSIVFAANDFSNIASTFNGGVIDILDYTSTNKNKTVRFLQGSDRNGSGYIEFGSGGWSATPAAITTINLATSSGSFQEYSQFALYGIRGA